MKRSELLIQQRFAEVQRVVSEINPILDRNPALREQMHRLLQPGPQRMILRRGVPTEVQVKDMMMDAFLFASSNPYVTMGYEDEKRMLEILDTSRLVDRNGRPLRGRRRRVTPTLNWSWAGRLDSLSEDDNRFYVNRKLGQLATMIHYNQFRNQFPPRKGRNWNMRGVEIAFLSSLQAAAKVVKAEIENTPEGRTGALGLKGGECPFDVPSINKLSKWAGGGKEVRKSLSRRYEKLLDCEIRHLCDPPYQLIGAFRLKHFGAKALGQSESVLESS